MKRRTEAEFIESIDNHFPFGNYEESTRLIVEAAAISENAVLMVGYEIAASAWPDREFLIRLLADLEASCPSPGVAVVAPLVAALVRQSQVSAEAVAALRSYCRSAVGCYNALAILELVAPESALEAEALRNLWAR